MYRLTHIANGRYVNEHRYKIHTQIPNNKIMYLGKGYNYLVYTVYVNAKILRHRHRSIRCTNFFKTVYVTSCRSRANVQEFESDCSPIRKNLANADKFRD